MNEIFNKYAAEMLALDGETIKSEAAEKENTREQPPTDISLLYHLKPNGKDEKSIVEQAHPEPCVIAPSYDRFGGLVDNVQEAQDITIGWLNRSYHAKLTQHRYASQELLNELIRLGFFLDNSQQPELAKIADSCVNSLVKTCETESQNDKIIKTAMLQYLLAGLPVGLILLGLYNNFAYMTQGVSQDCTNSIQALQVYVTKAPDIAGPLDELIAGIQYVKELHDQMVAHSNELLSEQRHTDAVRNAAELSRTETGKTARKMMEQYKRAAQILSEQIMSRYVPLIKGAKPEEQHSSTPGAALSKVWDLITGSDERTVLKPLIGADIGEPGGLVNSLRESIKAITAKEAAITSYVNQNKDSLMKRLMDTTKEPNTPNTPNTPETSEQKPKSLLDQMKQPDTTLSTI